MSQHFKVLTVCTGNICRSPLAEQLIGKALADVPEVSVKSAGTKAMVGSGMPPHSLDLAHQYNVAEPESHVSRQMTADGLESADLILAMDRDHRRAIAEMSPRVARRVFTIREFARLADTTSDDDLRMEFNAERPATTAARLRTAIAAVALGRGMHPPLQDPTLDDVVDPYRHEAPMYQESAVELIPAVNSTVAVLRRALVLDF